MAPVYDAPFNLLEMKMPLCILTRLLNMVAFCSKLDVNCQLARMIRPEIITYPCNIRTRDMTVHFLSDLLARPTVFVSYPGSAG
jgi:hypothetical protein